MAERKVYCKVCKGNVKPRKDYQPSICEACKKFFIRSCQQNIGRRALIFTCMYDGKCPVLPNHRRGCKKCRYDKCIAVGMTSKFMRSNVSSSDGDSEQLTDSSKEPTDDKQVVKASLLVRDPIIYDGTTIEDILKTAVKAYSQLQGFEYLDATRPIAMNEIADFVDMTRRQVLPAMAIGLSYGRHFMDCAGMQQGLSQADVHMLLMPSLSQFCSLFHNLPGKSRPMFCGMCDPIAAKFLSWFPEFQSTTETFEKLYQALDKWRPSLVETAILFALVFFTPTLPQAAMLTANKRVFQIYRRRLLLAFDLLRFKAGKSSENSDRGDELKQHLDNCFQLTAAAGFVAIRCVIAVRDVDEPALAIMQHSAPKDWKLEMVCTAPVKRRKHYQPTSCEACRKFFGRLCQQLVAEEHINNLLVCNANSQCPIVPLDRRACRKCRYEKCIAAGLKSKFLRRNGNSISNDDKTVDSSENQSTEQVDELSPTETLSSIDESRIVCLVHDPVVYDGSAIESVVKTAITAFTHLHGLDFLEIKRAKPTSHYGQFLELQSRQIMPIISTGLAYGQQFIGCEGLEGLSPNDVHLLLMSSMSNILTLFNNLPGYTGASVAGINDQCLPQFYSWFPELETSLGAYKSLEEALDNWRPTLIETALLFGLLFFTVNRMILKSGNLSLFEACRRRMLLATDLTLTSLDADGASNDGVRRRHFERCFELAQAAGMEALRLSLVMRTKDPIYHAISHNIGPESFEVIESLD